MARRPAEPRWYLRGRVIGGRVWRLGLHSMPFTIGRRPEADLQLDSKKVSQQHAEIFVENGTLWIRDLGSTNGTFVNGVEVGNRSVLQQGDILHIADEQFEIFGTESPQIEVGTTQSIEEVEEGHPPREVRETRRLLALLSDGAVQVLFQPILSLLDGTLLGYEALGRGLLPDFSTLPTELFGIAERMSRATELSAAMRDRGLEQARELTARSAERAPVLFINSHPSEMDDQGPLLDSLRRFRRREATLPVVLEIHESAATDLSNLRSLREKLEELDVGLAFDDFGTGQARLEELSEVAPDYVKFNVGFSRDLHEASEKKRHMVEDLVKLMRHINIHSIVEGVETAAEAEACRRMGFDYGQGFYFGAPARLDQLT